MLTTDRLRAIYARLPKLECKGLCQHSCGPIIMTTAEARRVERVLGHEMGHCGDDLRCPMLGEDGRCTVYEVRPLICRLWGMEVSMQCPHGCRPSRYLSREEGYVFIDAVHQVMPNEFRTTAKGELGRALVAFENALRAGTEEGAREARTELELAFDELEKRSET